MMMTRPFILMQTDLTLGSELVTQLVIQVGALGTLVIVVAFMLFRIWERNQNAKIDRDKIRTEEIKENTKRDSLISDLAIKADKYSGEIAILRESLAEERGARNLLSEQLGNERKERLSEREELKEAIRDISRRAELHEKRIAELETELNGKIQQIEGLILERDNLLAQLSDKDNQLKQRDSTIDRQLKRLDELEKKIAEQSEQIQALAKQLAELDPPKQEAAVAVTTPTETPIIETEKEKE